MLSSEYLRFWRCQLVEMNQRNISFLFIYLFNILFHCGLYITVTAFPLTICSMQWQSMVQKVNCFGLDWVWEELIWTITKPSPSSASHHFCLRLFEWSQEFLRDLPVCGGRTWAWDHIQIPDLHTICQASVHMPFFTASLFICTGILVFVDCFIHFRTACAAQAQVAIYQYSLTRDPAGFFSVID